MACGELYGAGRQPTTLLVRLGAAGVIVHLTRAGELGAIRLANDSGTHAFRGPCCGTFAPLRAAKIEGVPTTGVCETACSSKLRSTGKGHLTGADCASVGDYSTSTAPPSSI